MTLRRLTLLLFLLALAPGIAGAQTKIGGCTTISAPGPSVLTKNITASIDDLTVIGPSNNPFSACIVIGADFVTLDLAGYTITGPGGNTFGIATNATYRGIEVGSGTVTNFGGGILLGGSGITVKHVRAIGNVHTGIDIGGGSGHRIVGNTANNNGSAFGIRVRCPAVVLENVANGNGGAVQIEEDTVLGLCTNLGNSPAP